METNRPNAGARAYSYISAGLSEGAFIPGTFITESDVAEALGISRTPVREALRRLNAQHMIDLVPGRGAFVPQVTGRTIRELMEVRDLIESHAVAMLGEDPPALLIQQLDLCLRAQSVDGVTPQAFIQEDRKFHQAIVDASGSALLSELYNSLRDRQTVVGLQAVVGEARRIKSVVEEHEAIAEALRQRNQIAAIEATRRHLKNTLDALMAKL